jgi:hypothetical protein
MEVMKDTMGDFTIPAISESPIMDVFPYFSGEEDELERLKNFTALKDSVPVTVRMDENLEMADVLSVESE